MKRIILLALVSNAFTSFAQWSQNPSVNNGICLQNFDQVNSKHISDLKGGAIVVWEDYRNDPFNKVADIYAQRINAAGNVMWTTNGVAICTDAAHQAAPTLVADSVGGAIIVWQDNRGIKRNLYAQRIDSNGVVQWTANGVGVTLRNYDQKNPKVLTDGAQGAVVLWQDSVGNDYDIYAQRLNSAGVQQWTNAVGVATGLGSQVNVKAQITANGAIFVVWQDKRNGSDYDIYVQKLDLAGTPQWTANGINICNVAGTQTGQKISLDYTGGAIITWHDKRNGLDNDVYAQRINAAGATQWAANGVLVANGTGNQSSPDLTTKGIANGVIIAWKDARNGSNNLDVYGQMLNLSGVPQWAANGIAIANAGANQLGVNVTSDGLGGAIISYQDSSGGSWDIRSQRVNTAGTLLWGAGGVAVGTAAGDQTNHGAILAESNGSSIYVFQDLRSGFDNDIYAYKLDANGAPVGIRTNVTGAHLISVYPNPSKGDITFVMPVKNGTQFILSVYDISGNKITSREITNASSYVLKEKLCAGVYFYTLQVENSIVTGKFVIEN